MKNKLPRKYKVIIIFQFVMIVFLFYCLLSDHYMQSSDKWFKENSPDGQYNVQASFPEGISTFSASEAQILIYDNFQKKYINSIVLYIDTNGKYPNKDNYNLEWHEDYVIITTINSNGKSNSVRVYWEDL